MVAHRTQEHWLIVRHDGHVFYADEDPVQYRDNIAYTVEGPFVPVEQLRGAVDLLREIGHMAGAKATGADARAMAKRAREFTASVDSPSSPRQSIRTEGEDR